MRWVILISVFVVVLLFTGCSEKPNEFTDARFEDLMDTTDNISDIHTHTAYFTFHYNQREDAFCSAVLNFYQEDQEIGQERKSLGKLSKGMIVEESIRFEMPEGETELVLDYFL